MHWHVLQEQEALQHAQEVEVAAEEARHAEHNLQLILADLETTQGQLNKV